MPARNKNLMETLMFRRKHLRSTPAIFKTPIKWAPRTPFPALQQAEIGSMENGEPMMAQQLFAASRFLNWAQTNPQEIAEEATVQGIADWNGNESAATGEAANESTSNTTRKVLAIHVATTTAVEEEEEVKARPLLGGRRKFTGAFRWAQVEPTAAALLLMRPPTRSQNQLNLLEGMEGPSSSGGNGRQQPIALKPKKPVGRPPSRKKRAPPRNLKKEPPANVEPEMQIVPQVQDIVFNEEPATQVKQEVVSRPSTSGYEEPNAAADEEMPELVAEEPMDLEAESTYHPLPIEPSESEDGIVEQLQQQKQQVTQKLAVPSEVENAEPGESPPPNDREGHLDVRRGAHITKNFKVAKRLGAGVFATVFLVRDLNTAKPERQYALKVARNTNEYRAAAKAEIKALEQLKSRAGQQHHFVAQFLRSFDYWGHTCLLFEQYGLSILDFLKTNQYHPFRVNQIREIAYQLIHAVHFLHNSGFVHTDLKPENILFVNSNKCEKEKRWDVPDPKFEVKSRKNKKQTKISVLKDTSIRVIDLGSAREMTPGTVHNDEISTSHYRAPEVILGMGWSYPADVWSLGCILFELYTGHFLFPKLRNLSHLAMMEATLDKFPYTMLGKAEEKKTTGSKYVYRRKLVRDDDIVKTVKENAKRLTKYQKSDNEEDGRLFMLIEEMLVLDPEYRIVLENAKDHSFFYKLDSQYRKKIDLGGGDHETEMKA